MHDHSLGEPVDVERYADATHPGPCSDGVYGCSRCWNSANDGKGTIGDCEWCDAKDVPTKVTRASDEPVSYAVCEPCRERQRRALEQELEEYGSPYDYVSPWA